MGIKLEMQTYELVEQGYYRGIVSDVEEATGQYGPQLKFKFQLLDEGLEDRRLTAWCSAVLSPKSKLNKWATAILGEQMPADGMLDCDDLINRKVILDLTVEPGKDGAEFNKVRDVLPWKSKSRPAIPQRPAPVATRTTRPTVDEYEREFTAADEAAALADTSASLF